MEEHGILDRLKTGWASAHVGSNPTAGTVNGSSLLAPRWRTRHTAFEASLRGPSRMAPMAAADTTGRTRPGSRPPTPANICLPSAGPETYTSRPMRIDRSMTELGGRLSRARADLRILDEQLLFQLDVLEEAKTRMLVSETPVADREFRIARDDYNRLERQRSEAFERIAELQREQDRLLDGLLNA